MGQAKQSEGRRENAAVPDHEIVKGARSDKKVAKDGPQPGSSVENAGMGRNGLGRTH
jgi:hypothetical protein